MIVGKDGKVNKLKKRGEGLKTRPTRPSYWDNMQFILKESVTIATKQHK